ncbi:hypothetical protein [Spirosoma endbachense]|uniref:Uncharacterized protein n=1 Tax=Spirosoma endbachense TaxID=2666025 RepID=A0A6P1VUL4_9BACT|nr:hypothetical protein [Spirosoma endbachense]QHV95319.1 hypothetical protein GJR95_09980 [Spirosoma endbachense]
MQLNLTDLQGRVLHHQRLDEAGSLERVSVPVGMGKGLLLLQVNTAQKRQQVKLLKPWFLVDGMHRPISRRSGVFFTSNKGPIQPLAK